MKKIEEPIGGLNFSHLKKLDNFAAFTIDFSIKGMLENVLYLSNLLSDFIIVSVVVRGSCTIKINLQEFKLKTNDLYFIAPDAVIEMVEAENNLIIKTISNSTDFLLNMRLPYNSEGQVDYLTIDRTPVWPLTENESSRILQLMDQMELNVKAIGIHPYGEQILNHTFIVFFYELRALGRKYSSASLNRHSRKENLTINYLSLVKKNFRTHRLVKHYAELLYITPKYLTETIKEQTNKTAGEVIDSFVMLEAKTELANTTKGIAQIADELHFSDQSFFGKYFKRHAGVSPKVYRSSRL